jgi:hypothetical protein
MQTFFQRCDDLTPSFATELPPRHSFALTTYVFAVTLAAGTAAPAGQFGLTSDILGFSLSMSQNEAADFAHKTYPNAPFLMLPVGLVMAGVSVTATGGFVLETKPSQPNGQSFGVTGGDRLKVLFNPNKGSSDIFAISRYVNFGVSTMTMATLRNSLFDKYGKPTNTKEWGVARDVDFVWAGNSSYAQRACEPNTHSYYPYFYEDVWLNRPLVQSVDEMSRGFVNYLNGSATPRVALRVTCGQTLVISIRPSLGAADYAVEMRETLVDLTRGTSELKTFHDDFFGQVDQIKKHKESADAKAKPRL